MLIPKNKLLQKFSATRYSLYIKEEIIRFSLDFRDFMSSIYSVGKVMSGSPGLMNFAYNLLPATHEITYLLGRTWPFHVPRFTTEHF